MSEQDTYVRAKLAEISTSLERLANTLNRMIEVVSKIGEIQDAVIANSRKLDEIVQGPRRGPIGAASAGSSTVPEPRPTASPLQALLDTLDSQVREGAIASDLALKINEAAETLEQKGIGGSLIVRMQRWTRILRTYNRIDPISASDLKKLRDDLRDWQREIAKAQ
jgi:hypothetical protein